MAAVRVHYRPQTYQIHGMIYSSRLLFQTNGDRKSKYTTQTSLSPACCFVTLSHAHGRSLISKMPCESSSHRAHEDPTEGSYRRTEVHSQTLPFGPIQQEKH
jgi:hypothetical protein